MACCIILYFCWRIWGVPLATVGSLALLYFFFGEHLPGFVEHAADFKDKGVDTVACMSVNDVFVMGAWGDVQGTGDNVLMLADGNGDFTRALGLEMDATGFGMGERSQRFALVADDGVITGLYVEAPGEFRVSSAESVLAAL